MSVNQVGEGIELTLTIPHNKKKAPISNASFFLWLTASKAVVTAPVNVPMACAKKTEH